MKKKRIRKEVKSMRQNAESLGAINRVQLAAAQWGVEAAGAQARAESHEYWAKRLGKLERKLR